MEPFRKTGITSTFKTDFLALACKLDILDKDWKIKPQYVDSYWYLLNILSLFSINWHIYVPSWFNICFTGMHGLLLKINSGSLFRDYIVTSLCDFSTDRSTKTFFKGALHKSEFECKT